MSDQDDIESDPAARELKAMLCESCYRSLIDWITGKPVAPFSFCAPCAPLGMRWLEKRRLERDEKLS